MVSEESPKLTARFTHSHYGSIVLASVLLAVIIWSSGTLLTKPRLWIDEAISINIARSFMTEGVLSPQIAPDRFFEFPELIQSTGYPVTVLLAGFFKVFGYGIYQARIFMLVWVIGVLLLVFLLAKKLFGLGPAYGSLLLIASFASFYGSGRTAVGEIPGFAFLLAGWYFFLIRDRYLLAGVFWGLAVVAKPSVFSLIIPAITLAIILERKDCFRKIGSLGCGMIPAALLWVVLVLPRPFSAETWVGIGAFYKNPYSSSISENIIRNLTEIFHSTTLIYFGILLIVILAARFILKEYKLKIFYTFTLLYSLLAFVYYLRSPGWLRYILIAELLILFILPHAIGVVNTFFRERYKLISTLPNNLSISVWGFLVAIQILQMFTVAQIFSSEDALQVAAYLKVNSPLASVGLLNAPEVGILLKPSNSFLVVDLTGMSVIGENPLLNKNLPDVVVSHYQNRFFEEGKMELDNSYVTETVLGGYTIYKRVQHE